MKTPKPVLAFETPAELVRRFARYPGFPADIKTRDTSTGKEETKASPGLVALIRAFQNAPSDPENALKIAELLEEGHRARGRGDENGDPHFAPLPVDVYSAAAVLNASKNVKEFRGIGVVKCAVCQDMCMVPSKDGAGYVRCSCVRGKS